MMIYIKQIKDFNYIYLIDETFRPISISIENKENTHDKVKNILLKNNVTDIKYVKKLNFTQLANKYC